MKILQPVYSLNIVNDVFETDLPEDEYYHYYQLVHEKHSEKIIEGLHIAFVELPKFKPTNAVEQKMRNLWLRFLTEINPGTEQVPPELLENPLTNKAISLMEEAGMTEGERYAYEKNIDNVWVEQIIVRELKRRAMVKAKELGIAEGKELGSAETLQETAHKMLDMGFDAETIRKITGLSVSEFDENK